jgi:hypothetical protein
VAGGVQTNGTLSWGAASIANLTASALTTTSLTANPATIGGETFQTTTAPMPYDYWMRDGSGNIALAYGSGRWWMPSLTVLGSMSFSGGMSYPGTGFPLSRNAADRAADTVNAADLVSGLDPTGVADNSVQIKSAHDQAYALGYRYLHFAKGTYNAPTLSLCGNVIFVGDGAGLIGAYRKMILPLHAGTRAAPADLTPDMTPKLRAAIAAATPAAPARIILVGDSTTTAALSLMGLTEWMQAYVSRKLRFDFANKPIQVVELGIGGTTWAHLASSAAVTGVTLPAWYTNTSARWMSYLAAQQPAAMVIFNFGQNDNSTFDVLAVESVLTEIKAWAQVPDFVFLTNYCPANSQASWGDRPGQEAREFAAGYTRTFCRRKGYGLLDVGRQADIVRDGFDPVSGAMQHFIYSPSSLAITTPWSFPAANETLHFALNFSCNPMAPVFAAGKLCLQIGANPDNILILERDSGTGNLAYSVQSCTTSLSPPALFAPGVTLYLSVPKTVTTLSTTQTGGFTVVCEVRDAQLYMRVSNNTASLDIDLTVDRYGGLFQPRLFMSDGSAQSFTVALASSFVVNKHMPQIIDHEAFDYSGPNHITSVGMARVYEPVIQAARFN